MFKLSIIKLLKKGEKITRTDNVYLAKSFSALWSYQSLTMLNGLILYFLFARYVSATIFGEYKYYLTVFELFGITTLTGAKIALIPAIAQGFEGTLPILFKSRVRYGMFGSLAATLAALYFCSTGSFDMAVVFIILALVGPWIHAAGLTTAYFIGKKDFGRYAKTSLFLEYASFLLVISGIIFWPYPVAMFIAYLAASGVNLIIYHRLSHGLNVSLVDPRALTLSRYYSVLDGLNILTARIDSLILFNLLGPAALALYSFATLPVDQMRGFLNHFQTAAFPKISIGDYMVKARGLMNKIPRLIILITIFVSLYIFIARNIYIVLFPNFLNAVGYSQVYALSLIFSVPATLFMTLYQAQGKKNEAIRLNTLNNVIQIFCIIPGVIYWGLLGAVLARLIGSILMLTIATIGLTRILKKENIFY